MIIWNTNQGIVMMARDGWELSIFVIGHILLAKVDDVVCC
jgi:hypothetical protein